MTKIMTAVGVILLFGFVTNAAIDTKNGGERYLLKGNASVQISMETGWQRDGMIPLRIEMQGVCLDLWMDGEGRVFDEPRVEPEIVNKNMAVRRELFRLDKSSGQLQAGDKTLNGQVYEQNALRTRLRLNNLTLALQLDIQKDQATLYLAGIAIPVRVRLGKESGNGRELEIGEQGHREEGRLVLDTKHDRILYEDIRPGIEKQQSSNINWAEKRK